MVQIIGPTPRQMSFADEAGSKRGDSMIDLVAAISQKQADNKVTQRQQALDVLNTAAKLRESGFDVTPDQVAQQFKQADSGGMFGNLFGNSSQEVNPLQGQGDLFSKRTPEYLQKQQDASIDRKLKQAQLYEIGKPFLQSNKGQEFVAKETFEAGRKRVEKEEKDLQEKQKSVLEIESRKQNIMDNLHLLKNQIKEDGTYELFGSHNQDLVRRGEQVATDMAKLIDPQGVARPTEVEMYMKSLGVEPNMASSRNTSVLKGLDNFENEVNKRAQTAYEVRGLPAPGQQQVIPKVDIDQIKSLSREEKLRFLQGR